MGIQIELASQDSPLVIAVKNTNGCLEPIQELTQFLNGKPDPKITCMLYGRKLFDILYDDHGLIRYDENEFVLCKIIETKWMNTVMGIMGKVGESVLVRRCMQDANLNLKWMRIASRRQVQSKTATEFRAVGTGFKSTKQNYPQVYNPADTQRDIIWIDGNGYHYQMKESTGTAGIDAGLQVKVSTHGMSYVYRDVLDAVYSVPLVYFDVMSKDYGLVYRQVKKTLIEREDDSRNLDDWFICGREIDCEAYKEIEFYTEMVKALVNGSMRIEDLIKYGEQYPSLGSAIMAESMKGVASQIYLES